MLKRKNDSLWRIYIPKKIINELKLSQNQEMEITLEYGEICLKKFQQEDIRKRKFVGIVRSIDSYYRINIPREYMKLMGLKPGNKVTFKIEEETIKLH